jgi:hypothetical protein
MRLPRRRRPAGLRNDSRCQRADAGKRHRPGRASAARSERRSDGDGTRIAGARDNVRDVISGHPALLPQRRRVFGPAAGYSGLFNPAKGRFVEMEPSLAVASAYSRSVGRMNDRPAAAPCATGYERVRLIGSSTSPILAGARL